MGQNLDKIEDLYDTVAKEYAEAFSGEHEKKPKDREILRRFAQRSGTEGLSGISAVVPGKLQNT